MTATVAAGEACKGHERRTRRGCGREGKERRRLCPNDQTVTKRFEVHGVRAKLGWNGVGRSLGEWPEPGQEVRSRGSKEGYFLLF